MAAHRTDGLATELAGPAYGIGVLFILTAVVDTVSQMWPPAPSEPSWRYGVIGIGGNYLITVLFGILLICLVAGLRQHRRTLRVLAIVNAVLAVLFVLAVIGFVLDVLQVRYSVPKDNPRAVWLFNVGAAKAVAKYVVSALVLGWLAWASRRAWRAMPRPTAEEAPRLVRESKAGG